MKKTLIAVFCVFALCALVVSNMTVLGTRLVSAAPSSWKAHPMTRMRQPFASSPSGLSPSQIRTGYNLPSTGGQKTIAIVDAFDDPTALNDLNVFSTQFGLPAPNFEKHMMSSGIPANDGWALEISLDIQWAHAIAPNAKILLVEATSNDGTDLLAAVDYARSRSDVIAVSMSWGGPEFSGEASYDSYFTSSYGAAFFSSSGDSGAGTFWPAVSANVIAVGGTKLTFSGGMVSSETAWSGSGGGVSAYVSEPSYQVTYGVPGTNGKRAVPDVSYDADPDSGVSVYDSTPYSGSTGWWVVGGTSAGAPQWAAIQSLGLTASNSNFYHDAKSASCSSYFRDITSGSNGYPAKVGYDLVTGLGSPLTTNFTPLIIVPDDYPTIQAAINAASDGDTVFVRNGVYYGSIILNKTVSLIGENRNTTILNGDGAYTVVLMWANNSCVDGFTITSANIGVQIEALNCTICNNNVLDNTDCGIFSSSSNDISPDVPPNWRILGNIIINNSRGIVFDGVYYWTSTLNLDVVGNTITDNDDCGVCISWARDMNISRNVLLNNTRGIQMQVCGTADIIENVISNNSQGMYFQGLDGDKPQLGPSNMTGNQITENIDGIVFDWTQWSRYGDLVLSEGNDLICNNITGNSGNALRLVGSSNNSISGNVISTNSGDGIDMDSFFYFGSYDFDPEIGEYPSSNNTISGNRIEANQYGTHVVNSSGNRIYDNNFVNNSGQVYTENSKNIWDDGYPSGGNYWSDYTDVDLHSGSGQTEPGGDGIWDHPYTLIDTNNTDPYPLVSPWVAEEAPSLWVEPVAMTFQTDTVSVGHLFNVTLYGAALNGTDGWECELGFNATQLHAVAVGFAAGVTSELFADHPIIMAGPVIDNSEGTVYLGEVLLGNDYIGDSSGRLFWVTFNITAAPQQGANLTSFIDPGYGVASGETCFIDTNGIVEPGLSTGQCTYTYVNVSLLFLVVRGEDNGIYYRIFNEFTSTWGVWNSLPGATCDSPAASVCQNQLHIIVRGMDGNSLWHGWVDLTTHTFSEWNLLSGATNSAVAFTSNGTTLCLAVRGLDDGIYYRFYGPSTWGPWLRVPDGATSDTPAAALVGDELHLVVRGMDDNSLWHRIVRYDGASVKAWTPMSGATDKRPAMIAYGGYLFLSVRGLDNGIYIKAYDLAQESWGIQWFKEPGGTCDGPGIAVANNQLHVVVRGMDGTSLWHEEVNAAPWSLMSGSTPSAPTLTS